MPKQRSRDLPSIHGITERATSHLDRQLIYVLRVEVMANVIVTRTVIAGEFSGQRRKNASRRKLQEAAVRNCVHAATPGVVDLTLQTMTQTLHPGQLQAVVVAVFAG